MLYDGIQLAQGADIENLTADSGTSFPPESNVGEMFYRSDLSSLYVYNGTTWLEVGSSSQGATGPTGPTGPSGQQGPTGPAGTSGTSLPSVSGQEGKFLTNDGTNAQWAAPTPTPAGSSSQIQYNDNGTLAASSQLTFNKSTGVTSFGQVPQVEDPDPAITAEVKLGYLVLPRTTTFNANAKGKRVVLTTGITIPSATYAAGDAFSFYNSSANLVTITAGAGLTLRQDGTSNTGNRNLAGYGTCFIWFNTANEAIISGSIS
jgi:hypothetical protein